MGLGTPTLQWTCLEGIAGRLEPLGSAPVAGNGLLAHHSCQVEKYGRLLEVHVVLRYALGGAEGVKPRKVDLCVDLLLADWEACLNGCKAAVVPAGGLV